MGSRTMDAPSLGGRTVARHIAPKAVRLSRKRALRRAAHAQKLGLARPDEQPKQKQARQVPVLVGAQAQLPAKPAEQLLKPPAEQPKRRWAFPRVAKPQPPAKPVEQPNQVIPAKPAEQPKQQIPAKAAEQPKHQTPAKPAEQPKQQKPSKQPKQKQPTQVAPQAQEPSYPEHEQVIDDPKPVPLDHLEDGVVDWGIKREE